MKYKNRPADELDRTLTELIKWIPKQTCFLLKIDIWRPTKMYLNLMQNGPIKFMMMMMIMLCVSLIIYILTSSNDESMISFSRVFWKHTFYKYIHKWSILYPSSLHLFLLTKFCCGGGGWRQFFQCHPRRGGQLWPISPSTWKTWDLPQESWHTTKT